MDVSSIVRSFATKSKRRTHWVLVGSNPQEELRQLPKPAYCLSAPKGRLSITRRHGHVDSGLLNQRGQMSEPIDSHWQLIGPFFSANDIGNRGEPFATTIAKVPRSAALRYAAHMSLSETQNGGFQDAATGYAQLVRVVQSMRDGRHLTENRLLGYRVLLTLRPTTTANRSRSMLRLLTPVRCFSTRHSAPGCIGRSCRRYSRQLRGVRPLRRFARHGWAEATRDQKPTHERASR